jgi:hypothetical protein
VKYTAKGYKGATEEYLKPVTVEANGTAYINTYLESESYVPPTVVYENYPDEIGDNKAYGVADKYNVAAVGEETSPLATQLEGKTVRRQIIRNGHLFVLALDAANEPFIYDVNLADNSVAEISTEGTTLEENRQLKISDIAFTADNVLVATSYGENQFDNNQVASGDVRGSVAIYKWTKNDNELPTGAPALWFTSQNSGNYYNALTGRTIAASGTSEEGSIVVTAQTKGSSTSMRFIEFSFEQKPIHPTQKPLALMEYLVKTYTNEGDIVLDNTMGSGTTILAAIKNNRIGIGIEKEKQYYDVAVRRASEYCH